MPRCTVTGGGSPSGPGQLPVFYPTGGSAHGKLFPGDQILQMNNELAEDLSCERAADILRYSPICGNPESVSRVIR